MENTKELSNNNEIIWSGDFFSFERPLNYKMNFKCENCGFTNDQLDIRKLTIANGYVHCTKCDSYHRLICEISKTRTLFYLKLTKKKKVLEEIMIKDDENKYGNFILDA